MDPHQTPFRNTDGTQKMFQCWQVSNAVLGLGDERTSCSNVLKQPLDI